MNAGMIRNLSEGIRPGALMLPAVAVGVIEEWVGQPNMAELSTLMDEHGKVVAGEALHRLNI